MVKRIKIILSLFILYHLYAVTLIPNSQTYLGLKSAPWIEPYVNFFEFVTQWGFFAPEPGPPPLFIEYELVDQEGKSIEVGRWPEIPDPYFLRERQNRKVNVVRFMATATGRAEMMMAPYFCKQNPKVSSVRLWRLYYNLPSLEQAAAGVKSASEGVKSDRYSISNSFCKEFSS